MRIRNCLARAVLGVVVLSPLGAVVGGAVVAGPASAAAGTSCAGPNLGVAKLSPGISATPAVQTVKGTAKLKACTGGVTSGTLTQKLKGTTPASCATLTSPSTNKGTYTVKWNTGASSTIAVTISGPNAKGQFTASGKVTKGLFAGGKITSVSTPTGVTGDCVTTPITAESFSSTFALS